MRKKPQKAPCDPWKGGRPTKARSHLPLALRERGLERVTLYPNEQNIHEERRMSPAPELTRPKEGRRNLGNLDNLRRPHAPELNTSVTSLTSGAPYA